MDEPKLERYLNELREQPFSEDTKGMLTAIYLLLDSELKRLEAVLALMKHKDAIKDAIPNSEAYQQEMLESATHNLTLIKEFLKETGRE